MMKFRIVTTPSTTLVHLIDEDLHTGVEMYADVRRLTADDSVRALTAMITSMWDSWCEPEHRALPQIEWRHIRGDALQRETSAGTTSMPFALSMWS